MCKVNFNRLKLRFDFGNIGFDGKNVRKKIKYINIQRY